jgi:peptidoglycan/LPS O-acetylase OafA/YrhL
MRFLDRFSRITSGRALIPQIDGLRFIAIIGVLAYHVRQICSFYLPASPSHTAVQGDLVNDVFFIGQFGVPLFFGISGFILSLPFARHYLCGEKRVGLGGYYLRRVTRIEPPYIIQLIFLFALCALVLHYEPSHQEIYHNEGWAPYSLKHILASLFYLNGFIYGMHPYPNIVLWSLEVEVQFYILAPLLAGVFKIRHAWARRGLILGAMLLGVCAAMGSESLMHNPYRITCSLAGNLQYFLAGFLLADLYLTGGLIVRPRSLKWDFLFFLMFAIVTCLRNSGAWLTLTLPFVVLTCLMGAFRGELACRFLSFQWVTTIGGMCYTIYMYHALIISVVARLTCRWQTHVLWLDMLIQFLLISGPVIVLCAVLFALFERPFMRKDWPILVRSTLFPRPKMA